MERKDDDYIVVFENRDLEQPLRLIKAVISSRTADDAIEAARAILKLDDGWDATRAGQVIITQTFAKPGQD